MEFWDGDAGEGWFVVVDGLGVGEACRGLVLEGKFGGGREVVWMRHSKRYSSRRGTLVKAAKSSGCGTAVGKPDPDLRSE